MFSNISFPLQQVNYKMHMNIRRMNDRKHHKRSKRASSKVIHTFNTASTLKQTIEFVYYD